MSEKLKELEESMNLATLLYLQELRKIKYETFVEETKINQSTKKVHIILYILDLTK